MTDNIIADSVEKLFSSEVTREHIIRSEKGEFQQKLWELARASGLPEVMTAEKSGGIEADWSTTAPLFMALGYYQVPLPIAETSIASFLLSAGGTYTASGISEGPIALVDEKQSQTIRANSNGTQLSGIANNVNWAQHSSYALIGLQQDFLALVALNQPGVEIRPAQDLSGMACNQVVLTNAKVDATFQCPWPELTSPVRTCGAVARSAMMVGALEFLLEQSIQYAQDRIQFGKPIGSHQAIQHQLAELAREFSTARVATLSACKDMPSVSASTGGRQASFSAAVAKIRAGDAATRGTYIAHQVHGAIGFTYEHSLNFATRRLWAWRQDFGTSAWWAQKLGESFLTASAEQFWPAITQRTTPTPMSINEVAA